MISSKLKESTFNKQTELLVPHDTIFKYLSIGTPKITNFTFVPNVELFIFRCPKIVAHYSLIFMCLNIGTPKNHKVSIWDKWKFNGFMCPNTEAH